MCLLILGFSEKILNFINNSSTSIVNKFTKSRKNYVVNMFTVSGFDYKNCM